MMDNLSHSRLAIWLIRLLGWDGLMPAAIWLIPFVIRTLVPQAPGIVEAVAVILPIVAFFVRFRAGVWYIATNRCGRILRSAQFFVLCCAILVLAIVDAVVILTNIMPKGALTESDMRILASIYTFYLTCMLLALYPGFGAGNSLPDQSTANHRFHGRPRTAGWWWKILGSVPVNRRRSAMQLR